MKGMYKGFEISFNRHSLKCFDVNDIGGKYESIGHAEAAIDRHLKKNRAIERISVLVIGDNYNRDVGSFKEAEITSVAEDGDIWISDTKSNRSKQRSRNFICLNNKENKAILSRVIEMREKTKTLRKQADELLLTTDRAEIDKLIERLKEK